MNLEFQLILNAYETAEEFTKNYYESYDKKRSQMSSLYVDNATLVWDGNGIFGKDNIHKHLLELPLSQHHLLMLKAKPIIDEDVPNGRECIIYTGGMVKYSGTPDTRPFTQTIIISLDDNNEWKIVVDGYRFHSAFYWEQEN